MSLFIGPDDNEQKEPTILSLEVLEKEANLSEYRPAALSECPCELARAR